MAGEVNLEILVESEYPAAEDTLVLGPRFPAVSAPGQRLHHKGFVHLHHHHVIIIIIIIIVLIMVLIIIIIIIST